MNTKEATLSTRFKVGLFTGLALVLIGVMTIFVNDKPFWWRPCDLVFINIDDATGLKTKSPIRSLGLQIGYLRSVELHETYVRLGICITAPVEVLPATRAFIRGEGFLGDKFVELKPVKYLGQPKDSDEQEQGIVKDERTSLDSLVFRKMALLGSYLISPAKAAEAATAEVTPSPKPTRKQVRQSRREIPVGEQSQDVQHLVSQVDSLVGEMTQLTNNLKQGIDPKELRATMVQLNKTLENASKALSPEGGLNTTAQRTLAKLEDAIEQLRDQITRINRGEGSVGMLLNDPKYADEIHSALKNINKLLSKVGGFRFVVDLGAEQVTSYNGGRGWFKVGIWPENDRYYSLGISADPRGSREVVTTTTVAGGLTTTTQTTKVEQSALLFTAMLGRVIWGRIDLSAGVLFNDGAASAAFLLGPKKYPDAIVLRTDIYSRGSGFGIDDRVTLFLKPWNRARLINTLYFKAGVEGFRSVNGKTPFFYGGGITFDDEEIKLLFALR